jgi:hypothetical protein
MGNATRGHPADTAAAFAAIEAIEAGKWDHVLHRVRGAIFLRTKTEEYGATLIAGNQQRAAPEPTDGEPDA